MYNDVSYMKKWLVLLLSAFVAGFVILVWIHADCTVHEVVMPLGGVEVQS